MNSFPKSTWWGASWTSYLAKQFRWRLKVQVCPSWTLWRSKWLWKAITNILKPTSLKSILSLVFHTVLIVDQKAYLLIAFSATTNPKSDNLYLRIISSETSGASLNSNLSASMSRRLFQESMKSSSILLVLAKRQTLTRARTHRLND